MGGSGLASPSGLNFRVHPPHSYSYLPPPLANLSGTLAGSCTAGLADWRATRRPLPGTPQATAPTASLFAPPPPLSASAPPPPPPPPPHSSPGLSYSYLPPPPPSFSATLAGSCRLMGGSGLLASNTSSRGGLMLARAGLVVVDERSPTACTVKSQAPSVRRAALHSFRRPSSPFVPLTRRTLYTTLYMHHPLCATHLPCW